MSDGGEEAVRPDEAALPPAHRRGDGIGLEVTLTVVRGVRLAHDEPRRVAAVGEAPITRFGDDRAVLDALVRVHGQLGQRQTTARIAWFPDRSTMQRLDVTGRGGVELNAIRHELASEAGINSTMLVEFAARRWMLVLRWDHQAAGRLERLAERAGFIDVSVEPAPVALGRVIGTQTAVARRDAGEDQSWAAIFDAAVPIAAATVPQASRIHPDLVVAGGATGVYRLDEILGAEDLAEVVDELAAHSVHDAGRGGELELGLVVGHEPYPPFPAHDLRSPQRQAVALGAAVGAAGLAGRLRPVDVLAPTRQTETGEPRPWAVERIVQLPPPPRHRSSRWRRVTRRVTAAVPHRPDDRRQRD